MNIGQILTWKVFLSLQIYLTNFRKTVETGVDPHLSTKALVTKECNQGRSCSLTQSHLLLSKRFLTLIGKKKETYRINYYFNLFLRNIKIV